MTAGHKIPGTMTRSILQSLWAYFSPACETIVAAKSQKLRVSGKALRIPLQGYPEFRIEIGKQLLNLCPDPGITGHKKGVPYDFILFDPEYYLSGIGHFLRLTPGHTLVIDSNIEFQKHVFSSPREAFRRHLSITHTGDALIIKDPISELGTYILLIDDKLENSSIAKRRKASLMRILEIYGGPLAPLPEEEATERLIRVNELLRHETSQHRDSLGNPGCLLELPEHLTPIVVGDLHAQLDNLLKILSENAFMEGLENGSAAVIFLGDAVHQETPGRLEEMDSSLLMMDLIFSLKLRFPSQIIYITGNHDSFLHELMKQGVPQGLLWDKHVVSSRGEEYKAQLELFYQQSPLVVLSRDFIACHAGPSRKMVSRKTLIDARQFPTLIHDLTWGRVKTPAFPAGYTRSDVKHFRKGLQVSHDAVFIVGHYPFTENETLWLNVSHIKQHHIVISSRPDRIGLFTRVHGEMVPQVYPAEPLLDWLNKQTPTQQH